MTESRNGSAVGNSTGQLAVRLGGLLLSALAVAILADGNPTLAASFVALAAGVLGPPLALFGPKPREAARDVLEAVADYGVN